MRGRFGLPLLVLVASVAASCDRTRQEPLPLSVNEVMASNRNFAFTDENGLHLDWVEIFNPNAETVHLGGYTLTDNLDSPRKYRFPVNQSIPPGGFLVVFLVGDGDLPEPQPGEIEPPVDLTSLHADFAINPRQEPVAIFAMDGERLVDRAEVNNLATDISAGRFPDGSREFGPMFVPTPGAPNLPIGVRPLRWNEVPRAGNLRESEEESEEDPALFEASVTFSVIQDAVIDGFEIPLPEARVEVLDLEGECDLAATGEFLEVPVTLLEVTESMEDAACIDGGASSVPPDPDDGCRRDAFGNVIANVTVRTLRYEATLPPRACEEKMLFRVALEDRVSSLESPPTCFTYCGVPPTLVINEYVPKNRSTILFSCENCINRPPEDVRALDWLEVFNYGDEPIDLTDFGLSGDAQNPFAWKFGRDTEFDPEMTSIDPGEYLLIIADNDGGVLRRVYRQVVDGIPDTTRAFYSVSFGLDATRREGPDRIFLTAPTNEPIDSAVLDFSAFQTPGDSELNVLNDRSFGRFPDPSCFSRDPGIPPEGAGLDCFPPNVLQPGTVSDCPTPGAFNEPSAEGEPSCGAVSPRFADRLTLVPRCPGAGEPVILRTALSVDAASGDEFDVVITVDSTGLETPLELGRGDGITVTRSPSQAGAAPGAVLYDIEAVVPGQPAGALVTVSLLALDRVIDREARRDPLDDLEPEDAVARLDEESRTPSTEGVSFRFLSGFEPGGDAPRVNEILPFNVTVVVPGFVPAAGARGFPDYIELLLPAEAAVEEVDLSGHFLTDEDAPESLDQPILEPRRWRFPDGTVLRRGERRVLVFEEPAPDSSPDIVHVDAFDLDDCRERVFLVAPDDMGNCILDEIPWDFGCDPDRTPETVAADVALGRVCDRGESFRRLVVPSPGEFNAALPPLLHGVSHVSIFDEPNPCLEPGSLVQIQAFFLLDRALVQELGVQGAVSRAVIELEDGSTIEVGSQSIASQPLPGSYPAAYQDVLPDTCLRSENRLECHAAARFREVLSVPAASVTRYRVVIEDACGSVLESCAPGEFCFSIGSGEGRTPEVAINEINRFSDLPGSETGDRHWVELFNASAREVDAGGMSLSDDPASPRRARIPEGTVIPAGEMLLVLTDGGAPLEGNDAPRHVVLDLPWAQFRDPSIGARRCRENGRLLLFDTVENGSCLVSSFVFSFPPNGNRCLPSSSLGRVPDGSPAIEVLEQPSPGSRNAVPPDASFIRGDADGDGRLALTDAVRVLRFLFSGPREGACLDALDANDDGEINLTDAVFLFEFLFSNGSAPPPPFPDPGPDPTEDELDCGGSAP